MPQLEYRYRIRKLRLVPRDRLVPRPDNWRLHGDPQRRALRGALKQIGIIDACIGRELPDGRVELLDGHLRHEEITGQPLPVLIVDLTDDEARLALASLDTITAAADRDEERWEALLQDLRIESDDLRELLAAQQAGVIDELSELPEESDLPVIDVSAEPFQAAEAALESPEVEITPSFLLQIECDDESDQRAMYKRLQSEGRKVRVLTV